MNKKIISAIGILVLFVLSAFFIKDINYSTIDRNEMHTTDSLRYRF